MRIHTYPLGELQANCYLIENEGKGILIDPADDGSFLLEELQRKNIKLEALLLTHGHFDHCMAAGEIQMAYDNVETHCNASLPLYMHKEDQFLIDQLESTAEHFLGYKPIILPPKLMRYLNFGEFQISPLRPSESEGSEGQANFKFQILSTPGHTPGGVCYYFPEEKVIFTGDTLFSGAIGRTDLSYSNKKDLWSSLKTILALPEETIVYAGHGESTYIGQEKAVLG